MLFIFRQLRARFAYLALFLFSTTSPYAQERVFTLKELFSLADKNSKEIRFHQLAIREAEQGVKVARNAYLPSLSVKAEASYIGDGCMTDRDFSNRLNVLNHRLVTTLGIEPGTHIVPDTLYLKQVLIEERQESEWAAGIGASPTMQLAGLGIKLEQNRRKLIQSEQLPHISLSATNNLVSQQTILTSLKELFGIICICGTLLLVCIFTYRLWKRHIPLRYRG